jgi:hypothetical protein
MKFNETTHIISISVLILTVVYTLVYSGISGVLLCAAVAFIAGAFIEQLELVVAVTVLLVLLYTMVLKRYLRRFEGFENNPTDITARLRKQCNDYEGTAVKEHFLDKEHFLEGFEDAPVDKSKPSPTVKKDQVDEKKVEEVTSAVKNATEDSKPIKEDKESFENNIASQEFQSATNQLFKLGKMPSEHKEGPMLDAGGTLIKAMSSFDPETTAKMTDDTKKLLETQKSLMGMLTQMRPILADGKELLQTFSGMFGGQGGANSQFKLQ